MKISAIDIGSNSVRLLMWADGRSLYKVIDTTRLGEGLAANGRLSEEAMRRTVDAVGRFAARAEREGAERLFAFATAAVRGAANGAAFVRLVKERCGLDVDVLTGEEEAKAGLIGAIGNAAGGVIDVGGASSEVTVSDGKRIVYAKSLDLGAVRLKEMCGEDPEAAKACIADRLSFYGEIPHAKMYAVGGTATSVVALEKKLSVYDPAQVDGTILRTETLFSLAKALYAMPNARRLALPGMDARRADILGGGTLLLAMIARFAHADEICVREADNLEGYIALRLGEAGQ